MDGYSDNKRVLLLIDQMGSGGAERQLSYLAVCLKRAGYDVRLCQFYTHEVFYADDLRREGIEVEVFGAARKGWRRPFAIAAEVRRWNPQAVIAYLEGTAMGCCLARMLTPFRLIVSERNTTQSLTRKQRLKFLLYRKAEAIVPNSHSQSGFIAEHFPELRPKLHTITNMLSLERFSPDSREKDFSTPRVLTTARISPQKNIERYLKALSLLKKAGVKAHFDWYGRPSSADYLASILRLQIELGLEDYITFHSEGTRDVVEAYRSATHFCLPSNYEGFANVLCEAMACGLPACASDVCDNPVILNRADRLFNPADIDDMAAKIRTMLSISYDEAQGEGYQNKQTIASLCSAKAFTDAYINLIND